jgi:WD repeat-containing protein 1 (actin-interacting protein 1)
MSYTTEQSKLFAPTPKTTRGDNVMIDATIKGTRRMVYCSGTSVVIRDIDDPSIASVFTEHKANTTAARFSPNGEWVCSGDSTGRVIVWSSKNHKIKNETRFGNNVRDIAWGPEGKRIVACGSGGETKAKAFPWDSGNAIGNITGHSDTILSIDFSKSRPFRAVTCGEDRSIIVHNGVPFKYAKTIREHKQWVQRVRYSPDNKYFVTVGSDKQIMLFDGKTGDKVKVMDTKDGHQGSIFSVSWSPDSSRFLTVSGDKTAKIWVAESGQVETTFTFGSSIPDQQVGCVWVDADTLLTVSLSGAINYLDLANADKPKKILHGHNHRLTKSVGSLDAGYIFSGCNNGVVTRWDYKSGDGEWTIGCGTKSILDMAITCDAKRVATVSTDDMLRYIDIASNTYSDDSVALGGAVQTLAVGAKDADLAIAVTHKKVCHVIRGGSIVGSLNLDYDPTSVALACEDTKVIITGNTTSFRGAYVYNLSGNTLEHAFNADSLHQQKVGLIGVAPNGDSFSTADSQGVVYHFSTADGKRMQARPFNGHHGAVCSFAWAPDSSVLVTGARDQNFVLQTDVTTFHPMDFAKIKDRHMGGINSIQFLSNTELLSCGDDMAIKVWTVAKQ